MAAVRHLLLDADGVIQDVPGGWVRVVRERAGDDAIEAIERLRVDELPALRGEGDVLDDFRRDLVGESEDRYPDFRERSANLVTVSAGQGYSYSFTRTRARKEQTVVVVPAGESGYRIDGVVDAGGPPAATEMAQIIRSFSLGPQ